MPGREALGGELLGDLLAAELPPVEEIVMDALRDLSLEGVALGLPVGRGMGALEGLLCLGGAEGGRRDGGPRQDVKAG